MYLRFTASIFEKICGQNKIDAAASLIRRLRMRPSRYKRYVTSKNEAIIDIAEAFRSDYEGILSFVREANKEPDLFLVTDLQKWCNNEINLYKVDLYECEKDSVDGKDWWLCLKRKSNDPFEYKDIPPKITRSLKKVFPLTYDKFEPDKRSIRLMTSSNPNEVARYLKDFLIVLRK